VSRRQVTVTYGIDIDEPGIVDSLGADDHSDDAIERAIRHDIANTVSVGDMPSPTYNYDRDALIASVRAEIARRRAAEESE